MSDDTIPAGWESRVKHGRRSHCVQCGARGQTVTVVAQARLRSNGTTRSLPGARSVSLCNEHALALFAELADLIDGRRS